LFQKIVYREEPGKVLYEDYTAPCATCNLDAYEGGGGANSTNGSQPRRSPGVLNLQPAS
jgi:hypothetical protein